MTTPSNVPHVQTVLPPQVAQASPEVVAVATRFVRARNFVTSSVKKTVPLVITGTIGGLVAVRATRRQDSDMDVDTVDSSTE